MHVGTSQEMRADETCVAATPETVKKYMTPGHQVTVQSGADVATVRPNEAYVAAGARTGTVVEAPGAQIVFRIRSPETAELAQMQPDAVLVGMPNPSDDENTVCLVAASVATFVSEAALYTTRA